MIEIYDTATARAIILEGRNRGFTDEQIAARLNLSLAEIAQLEADQQDDLRDDDAGLVAMTESGRKSLARIPLGYITGRRLSTNETAALIVDALGTKTAFTLIERFYSVIGNLDSTAESLHIPKAIVLNICANSISLKQRYERLH